MPELIFEKKDSNWIFPVLSLWLIFVYVISPESLREFYVEWNLFDFYNYVLELNQILDYS